MLSPVLAVPYPATPNSKKFYSGNQGTTEHSELDASIEKT